MSAHQAICAADAADNPTNQNDAALAAQILGKRGGRPKGSCSSSLARWLRREIGQRRREGYRCRESFDILRDTEQPAGKDAFTVTDYTGDEHDIEPDSRVTWDYYKKTWSRFGGQKAVCVPLAHTL